MYEINILLLLLLYRSCNVIVKTCMDNAEYNSYTCIEYKLSIFRNTFNFDMACNLTTFIRLIRNNQVYVNYQVIVNTLIALIDVQAGHYCINYFNNNDIVA